MFLEPKETTELTANKTQEALREEMRKLQVNMASTY